MSTITPLSRDDALEILRGYEKKGKLFDGSRRQMAADSAADNLSRGQAIRIAGPFEDDVVGDCVDLQTLDTLLGSARQPNLANADVIALRALAAGVHETDGSFTPAGQQLDAYQLFKTLPHGVKVKCGSESRWAGSMDAAHSAHSWILRQVSPPIAETFPPGEAAKFLPATLSHVDTIEGLERLSFADAWSAPKFHEILSNPEMQATVAMCSAGALGFIIQGMGRIRPGTANLDDMCVSPQARGRKVGELLMLQAVQNARATGAPECFLEVDVTNTRAHQLYQKLGFKEIELLPNYYPDGHDGYRMQLTALQSAEVGEHLARIQQEVLAKSTRQTKTPFCGVLPHPPRFLHSLAR